jgi:thiol-disulfide isomerase/thioredoxin
MATLENVRLSYEGNMPPLAGATEWLNSEPLTATDLRGRVVVDFWTFTCINWIRAAPYRRAWDEKYREHGLTVIGVHTPEFPLERDVDSIRAAIEGRRIAYPVAVDSDYAIWNAFANRRLYQLVRQPGVVDERTFEITFLERGVEAYVFTFG